MLPETFRSEAHKTKKILRFLFDVVTAHASCKTRRERTSNEPEHVYPTSLSIIKECVPENSDEKIMIKKEAGNYSIVSYALMFNRTLGEPGLKSVSV